MNFNNPFGEKLIHNMRLSLIPLRSLRLNGNNVGIKFWGKVFFFIPRQNALDPPTSALFHFCD